MGDGGREQEESRERKLWLICKIIEKKNYEKMIKEITLAVYSCLSDTVSASKQQNKLCF